MRTVLPGLAALHLLVTSAMAQQDRTALQPLQPLSLDQQNKISEMVTERSPQPLTHINFALQRDAIVPADITLRRLPAEAESLVPEFKGYSYLAVEELVAIVDTSSRKVAWVTQRMRRQENTGAAK